jgi:hypothetical protein
VTEGGREVIDSVIETLTKSEMLEGVGEAIDRRIKSD